MENRTITARSGEPVPDQTAGKTAAAGVGAAVGGLLSAAISGALIKWTGADLSPELSANLLIVCTAAGAAIVGAVSAYYKRNYLK